MEAVITNLLDRFEKGALSRRDLIQGLTMLAAAGGAASAAPSEPGGLQASCASGLASPGRARLARRRRRYPIYRAPACVCGRSGRFAAGPKLTGGRPRAQTPAFTGTNGNRREPTGTDGNRRQRTRLTWATRVAARHIVGSTRQRRPARRWLSSFQHIVGSTQPRTPARGWLSSCQHIVGSTQPRTPARRWLSSFRHGRRMRRRGARAVARTPPASRQRWRRRWRVTRWSAPAARHRLRLRPRPLRTFPVSRPSAHWRRVAEYRTRGRRRRRPLAEAAAVRLG